MKESFQKKTLKGKLKGQAIGLPFRSYNIEEMPKKQSSAIFTRKTYYNLLSIKILYLLIENVKIKNIKK